MFIILFVCNLQLLSTSGGRPQLSISIFPNSGPDRTKNNLNKRILHSLLKRWNCMPRRPIALQKVYEAALFFFGHSFRIYGTRGTIQSVAEMAFARSCQLPRWTLSGCCCWVSDWKRLTSSRSLKRKTSLWSWDSFCLWGLLASGTSNRRQQQTRRLWGTARIWAGGASVKEKEMTGSTENRLQQNNTWQAREETAQREQAGGSLKWRPANRYVQAWLTVFRPRMDCSTRLT